MISILGDSLENTGLPVVRGTGARDGATAGRPPRVAPGPR